MKGYSQSSRLQWTERVTWSDLDPAALRTLIDLARKEDQNGWGFATRPPHRGDVTTRSLIQPDLPGRAGLFARQSMVICGLPLVPLILEAYGHSKGFTPSCRDGDRLEAGARIGDFSIPAGILLTAERVILNFLQRLSGIATLSSEFVKALNDPTTRVLDTRKTTPGYRALEKYAVATGGAWNHRRGLYDRVMIKDNHLAAGDTGSGQALSNAIHRVRTRNPDIPIEVEVDTIDQIPAVLEAGPDIILLDNFGRTEIRRAIALIDGKAAAEASGGISLKSIPRFAGLGLDFVSCGALVHQSRWLDIGLDWTPS